MLLVVGAVVVVAASVWLGLAPGTKQEVILIPAMLLGAGSTTMSVQALTLTADLIGAHVVSNS